ncbi:MAG: hypothetical protein JSS95_14760 [Acidobacteria bacterium]|nr:hypothetical protein [Acidobacteriota bacterium]
MGILDTITQLAGQAGSAAQGDQAKVAGGFIEALTAHPEGIQGVLESLKTNGMGDHIGSWLSGQAQTATADQVQQGLGPTGLIEKTAEHAGVSPAVVSAALATILPMVVQHFGANNASAQPGEQGGGMAGLAQSVLGKLLS